MCNVNTIQSARSRQNNFFLLFYYLLFTGNTDMLMDTFFVKRVRDTNVKKYRAKTHEFHSFVAS